MSSAIPLDNVRVLAHSAIRIEATDGTVAYFDPFELSEAPHDANVVFITHTHYDHLSPEDAAKVMNDATVVVCPASALDEVAVLGAAEAIGVDPGERIEVAGIAIEAVPAYNIESERLQFHPRENAWVGYVATVDGVRYYVAGDTDQNPGNSCVSCDVALVPVGGTYTMDSAQAASFVETIRPRVAVPTHYGSAVGKAGDGLAFAAAVDPSIPVVLKME